jgi:AcrR family transcriptional regulator
MDDWPRIHTHILQLEQEGLVTRTFRRLDPERQQTVINAILEEAAEKGPASLNIKQVAQRADVSVGSLYTYFANRDGLLDFAVELCVRFMRDSFEEFRPYLVALPLREALVAYLVGGVEWGKTQMGLVRFFARAAYHGDSDLTDRVVRPIATIMREMIQDMLTQAAARGEIPEDVDLETATRIVHALMIAVGDGQLLPYLNAYFQVEDEDLPAERMLEALIAFILRGIGAE